MMDQIDIQRQIELPWFNNSQKNLFEAYDNERLPHGIIIAAPNGSGKREFSNQFIKSILCEASKLKLNKFCGQCKSCRLFDAQTHPDFYLLDRLTDNKGKQKKSIGIDQVRNLTEKLSEMSQLSGWRVALIASVSALTRASFNALLKTLEEPGQNTLLILLSDNLQTIPATVKSRCRIIQPELKTSTLKHWLISQTEVNEAIAVQALNSCFNAPLKAKDFIQNNGINIEKAFYQLCDQLLLNQIAPHELNEKSGLDIDVIWRLLANYFYQVEKDILTGGGLQVYHVLPLKLPFQLYTKVLEVNRAQLAGSNLQLNLQLQAILIQWFEVGRKIAHISNS
jgi:DNA polymerase III subunit delta'